MSHGACKPVRDSVLGADDGRRRTTSRRIGDRGARATAWICCRPTTRSPASTWRSGTCSAASGRRAGLATARLRAAPTRRLPYASHAVRRHAGARRYEGAELRARKRLSRREVRLGAVRPRHRRGGREQLAARRARGSAPTACCWSTPAQILRRGRRGRRRRACRRSSDAARPGSRSRSRRRARGLCDARAAGPRSVALAGGEGCAQLPHGAAPDRLRQASATSRSTAAASAASAPAKRSRTDCARRSGVTYVNHTFTSHLALSASLQPYAGLKDDGSANTPSS